MAEYLTPDDLRPGTALFPDIEIDPGITDERLAAEIATQQRAFERECGDVFDVREVESMSFAGSGGTDIIMRGSTLRSVDAVTIVAYDGSERELDPGHWRVRPWGVERLDGRVFRIEDTVILETVEVGNPDGLDDAKRAVAILVYEALSSGNIGRRHARRWTNGEVWFEVDTDPDVSFGIPEVDRIVRRWRSGQPAVGAI